MTKTPRRSIISSFSALAAQPPAEEEGLAPERKSGFVPPTSGVIPQRVAAGVIGATQRTLSDIREERDRLQAQVQSGGGTEFDPSEIDPSPFQDRLPDDDAVAFVQLKESMALEGQKVPVQVRRHPGRPGRYQLVYGHRRWRAARELGLRLKAIVVELDDQALAVAQGIENAARQDLSWIEKALFAWRMEQAGIKARAIRAALSVDDPELARFRHVCRTLGHDLITALGRAPKTGRPRWVELAGQVQQRPEAAGALLKTLAAAKDRSSDERFALAAASLADPAPVEDAALPLRSSAGRSFGRAEFGTGGVRLKLDKQERERFAAFFRRELPSLMERYATEREKS